MTHRALPVVDVDACLIDRSALANCDACARGCPTGALRAKPEGLALVAELCTGCGACGAACPARAITVGRVVPVPLTEPDRSDVVALVCPARDPRDPAAVCVQALGLEALATLWLRGTRRIRLDIGACTDCPNGRGADLAGPLAMLNAVLADRGLPLMSVEATPIRGSDRVPRLGDGPDRRRRGLFGIGAAANDTAAPRTALARLQGLVPGRSSRRFAWTPVLDPQTCTACNLCLRLCPEDVLTLVGGETPEPAYAIQPAGCTGCALCAAACEDGAIRVETLLPEPDHLNLQRQVCHGCRVEFLRPAAQSQGDGLCPICARAPHYRKLHQVLP